MNCKDRICDCSVAPKTRTSPVSEGLRCLALSGAVLMFPHGSPREPCEKPPPRVNSGWSRAKPYAGLLDYWMSSVGFKGCFMSL